MPDDTLSRVLAEISQHNEHGDLHEVAHKDVPRLLALANTLLEGHRPTPVYALAPPRGGSISCACGHDENADCHFEAGSGDWLCQCQPDGFVCGLCDNILIDATEAEWPCRVYTDAARALLGEEASDA